MTSKNIDQQEIAKFNEMAAAWWDPQGHCKPLHQLNPLRLNFISERCSLIGKKILDVGCGGGILSESLANEGAIVTGIDMSSEALQIAEAHRLSMGTSISYQQSTVEDLAQQQPEEFDVISCMELLEHVPDPSAVIQACATLVKPKGKLFFSTLNRNLKAYLTAIIGAEYILKMLPAGTHDYEKFIRPSEFVSWSRQAKISIQEMVGIKYNPLRRLFELTDDLSVNYIVFCEKL